MGEVAIVDDFSLLPGVFGLVLSRGTDAGIGGLGALLKSSTDSGPKKN